jgi:uncharacterized OsmC-like protein
MLTMMREEHTCVELRQGKAFVVNNGRGFEVSRRDRSTTQGECPMQLLTGSLGACIVLTLDAVAQNKGIALSKVKARLAYTTKDSEICFYAELELEGALSDREKKILFQSARSCEVSKILTGNVQIRYSLQQSEAAAP